MHDVSRCVLVAEDKWTGCSRLRQALARAGYTVWESSAGRDCLHLAARRPGLIVLNGPLPDVGIHEMCHRLKADPATNDIPILFIAAGQLRSEEHAQYLEAGADACLTPPVDLLVAVATVRSLLRVRRVEEALRQSEGCFRGLFENAAVGMALVGLDGRWQRVNQKLCEIVGYSPEELLCKTFQDITHPEDLQKDLGQLDRLYRGQIQTYAMEKRYFRKDGRIVWINLTVSLQKDESGRPLHCIATIEDITHRYEAEQALHQAKREAEAANQAKDQFLATLSHELRTPLTPVLAAVSLLETDQRLDDDLRQDMEIVRRNVELEARLIDDLLDLTRIARGKLELRRQKMDLHAVLDQARRTCCDSDILTKHLTVRINARADDSLVYGDPTRLQQVFWNLISNAVKFTPTGGRIDIGTDNPVPGSIRVQVSDTGEGIESEALGRIFDAFEQGGRSVTRRFGGLGLGLAISKAIIDMHGGTIRAESHGKGTGAVFTIELPLVARTAVRPWRDSDTEAAPAAVAGQKLQILLVEDHADTARMMGQLLKMEGHEVHTASDVASALDLAERRSFHLIISDLGLPDASGLDLMRLLRARDPSLRGIALSGYGRDEDLQQSREAGFVEHLTKPVDLARLQAAITRVAAPGM